MNKNDKNWYNIQKSFNDNISLQKMKYKKNFLIPYFTLDGPLMIPLTTFYGEYIDRSKLTEEKEPIYKYSFSPTQEIEQLRRKLFLLFISTINY